MSRRKKNAKSVAPAHGNASRGRRVRESSGDMGISSNRELRELLSPVTPEDFISRYWEREPLYIPGQPDKFRWLFDRAAFDRAVQKQRVKGISIRVIFDNENNSQSVGAHIPINAHEIEGYLAQGASVCADPIDRGDEKLSNFAAVIKAQLNHAGQVSVKSYLSPDGAGFNTHYDSHIATTLQIEGRKRWRFSRQPGVEFPQNNAFISADGAVRHSGRLPSDVQPWERIERADEASFIEVVLNPGDVLCLPAGTWHNAKAIGNSLALNLSFAPLNFLDLFYGMLKPLLAANPEWRRSLPTVLAQTSSPGVVPPRLQQFFRARLDELGEIIEKSDATVTALHSVWRESVLNTASTLEAAILPHSLHQDDEQTRRRDDDASVSKKTSRRRATVAAPEDGNDRKATTTSLLGFDGGLNCSLSVKNLKSSVEWYRKVLGFELLYLISEFGWGELATATTGVRIGLSEVSSSDVHDGAILNFGVVDIQEARQQLEAQNVRFSGPTQVIHGIVKLATFYDPDGNVLMLYEGWSNDWK